MPYHLKHIAMSLGGFLLALLLIVAGCKKEEPKPVVQEVKVTKVIQKTVPIYFEAIGQTRGSVEVEVRARVSGYVSSAPFTRTVFALPVNRCPIPVRPPYKKIRRSLFNVTQETPSYHVSRRIAGTAL